MTILSKPRGSTFLTLLLVLFVWGLFGLVLIALFRLSHGSVAWYWWPIGFLTPPLAALGFGLVVARRERVRRRRERVS
ncbi:MAG: hypothetical protein QM775_14195 [Pirellulales bacterium]